MRDAPRHHSPGNRERHARFRLIRDWSARFVDGEAGGLRLPMPMIGQPHVLETLNAALGPN